MAVDDGYIPPAGLAIFLADLESLHGSLLLRLPYLGGENLPRKRKPPGITGRLA